MLKYNISGKLPNLARSLFTVPLHDRTHDIAPVLRDQGQTAAGPAMPAPITATSTGENSASF